MFANGFFRYVLISLVIWGACLLNSAWAIDPSPNSPVSDVALGAGGRLEGQVLDSQGSGVSAIPVTLKSEYHEPVITTTLEDGRFAFRGLSGGVYQVAAEEEVNTLRAWAPQTAPPAAQSRAIIYRNRRASGGNSGMRALLGNPIILSAVTSTAVALPIALTVPRGPASP